MAKKLFMFDIDLMGNQLVNAVTENRSTAPENPVAGQRYFDTTDKLEKVYDGENWVTLTTGGDVSALSSRVGALETDNTTYKGYVDTLRGDAQTTGSVAKGDADTLASAQDYADTKKSEVIGDANSDASSNTIVGAKKYAENQASTAEQNAKSYADTKKSEVIGASTDAKNADTINGAKAFATDAVSTLSSNLIGESTDTKNDDTINGAKAFATDAASTAQSTAISAAASDATTKANAAEQNAKSYADTKKSEAISAAASDATTKANAAETAAKSYTDTELGKLDATKAETGKWVKSVSQSDGQLDAVLDTIPAAEVSVADANSHFTGTNVEAVLDELYSQAGAGSSVEVIEVTSGLPSDVLKQYKIYQGGYDSTQPDLHLIGTINTPKDLVVTGGSVVTGTWTENTFVEDQTQPGTGTGKALKLTIANQTNPVYINVLDLVDVYTEGDGINVSATNVISIEIDQTSEGFLTVSANGIKLSGVQNAINTAEQNAKDYADTQIASAKSTIDNYTVNSKKISTNPVLNGSDIALTGYQKAAQANQAIAATDTVNQAIGKLEKEVEENESVAAQAFNNLDARLDAVEADNTTYKGYVDTLRGDAQTTGSVAKGDADTLTAAQGYADTKKSEAISTAASDATTKANTAEQNAKDYTDTQIASAVSAGVHAYSTEATQGNSITITAATHGCGAIPTVTTYLGGNEVECAVTINSSGDVTVAWNGSGVTAQTPLKIKIIG